jgi:hypothetical protein
VQFLLQAADALRDRGLRYAELARRGANASGLDHGDEIANLREAQGDNPPVIEVIKGPSYFLPERCALLCATGGTNMSTRIRSSLIADLMLVLAAVTGRAQDPVRYGARVAAVAPKRTLRRCQVFVLRLT